MAQYITSVLVCILAPLMGLLVWQIQRLITSRATQGDALMVLLRSQMRQLYYYYITVDKISDDELADFHDIYEIYHKLGGNGRATLWLKDLEKMERGELEWRK